ncbi:MAG: hypothetical protein ACPGU7_04060 [Gammaproteobacteria bacterium]
MAAHHMEQPLSCVDRFRNLSRGKKAIIVVMTIWAAQAVPKWTAAITADGELSASIMTTFVAPRGVN